VVGVKVSKRSLLGSEALSAGGQKSGRGRSVGGEGEGDVDAEMLDAVDAAEANSSEPGGVAEKGGSIEVRAL